MANAEHLAILKEGVEKWNDWRKENEHVMPDLDGADLSEADLNRANLSGAELRRAGLFGANLSHANLCEATLNRATLGEANLSHADLRGAELFRVDLINAYLNHADLKSADLLAANLTGANLSDADLMGAGLTATNLNGAQLRGANFNGAKIGRTVFGLTNLSTCQGLESVEVSAPCVIDIPTLQASNNLPKEFLIKLGIPDLLLEYLPDFYNPALKIYPAFLSHSWANKKFVRKLYDALIKKGVTIWFDEKKMKPGDDIYDSISKGIEYYDKMILVCSKESLSESWWVDRELDRVLKKERDLFKERGKRINLLIPITIDDHVFQWDGAKGEEVRRYVIGDFRDWQDDTKFEKAINDLIHALNANRPDVKPKSLL